MSHTASCRCICAECFFFHIRTVLFLLECRCQRYRPRCRCPAMQLTYTHFSHFTHCNCTTSCLHACLSAHLLPVPHPPAGLSVRMHFACLSVRKHFACLSVRMHFAFLSVRMHSACLSVRMHSACLSH
jgi:hypothetical protein